MSDYKKFFKAARALRSEEQGEAPTAPRRVKAPAPRKSRKPLPVGAIVFAFMILVTSVWALLNVEEIESLMAKVEIGVFGSAEAEEKGGKKEPAPSEKKEKTAEAEVPKKETKDALPKSWTPEQLAIFNNMEERKRALDHREQELAKLEEELQKQKAALEARFKELDQLREKISEKLNERVQVDQQKVAQLVEVYSNMKPQNAAKVFEEINEDLAVEVLGKMKKKNMADILNLLKPDKAQRLSEKFAGYKRQ